MTNKPKHILIVTSWYPSKERPTYGSFVEEQAQLLERNGYTISILQVNLHGTFLESIGKSSKSYCTEHYNGLDVIRLKTAPVFPKARKLSYKKLCKAALKIISEELSIKPNVIHSHSVFMGGTVANYISKKISVPFVHTEHTSGLIFDPEQYTRSDWERLENAYQDAAKVIFVSQFAQKEICKAICYKGANTCVIPNLIDPLFFEPLQKILPNYFSLVAIGNLIPRKNFDLLIRAIRIVLNSTDSNIQLTIHGEGQMKEQLIDLVAELDLKSHVTIKPKLTRKEVRQALLNNHLHVSASKLETFGLTIAESLACGTPVAVTDSGGVRDIVTSADGIISEGSPEALADSIIRIISNYDSFNPAAIQNRALEKFGESTIYSKLDTLYREINT